MENCLSRRLIEMFIVAEYVSKRLGGKKTRRSKSFPSFLALNAGQRPSWISFQTKIFTNGIHINVSFADTKQVLSN